MSGTATALLSAAAGVVAGIVTTAWKSRKELESQYDIDLRKRRIDAYVELWRLLEPLADYSAPGPVTRGVAQELAAALRRWYFHVGGLLLSSGTRSTYFNLQQALTGATGMGAVASSERLDQPTVDILKALGSRLRTSSTRDVATRVNPRLGPSLRRALTSRLRRSQFKPPMVERLSEPWRRLRDPLRIYVDRRWTWEDGTPEPAFFVVVENVSRRQVTVVDVTVEYPAKLYITEDDRRFELQPGDDREIPIVIKSAADRPAAPVVSVRLSDRHQLRSRATFDVPLSGAVLAAHGLDAGERRHPPE